MNRDLYTIKQMGERAILIDFDADISENTLKNVLAAREALQNHFIKEKVEITNAYHSLLVYYGYTIEDVYREFFMLEEALSGGNIGKNSECHLFYLPVCYEPEFGWDLKEISEEKGLPVSTIVDFHTAPVYTVFFIGFLPGFLYLGGMRNELDFPRKEQPRPEVPKGAVGIGGNQTGIYPKKSPGGWQIIGNCPARIFDIKANPPCEISAGDKVKFYAVSKEEYKRISEMEEAGKFHFRKEIYEG